MKNNDIHTPTPWHIGTSTIHQDQRPLVGVVRQLLVAGTIKGISEKLLAQIEYCSDSNFEFIVRAVNSLESNEAEIRGLKEANEALLEALDKAAKMLEQLRDGENCDHSVGVCWCDYWRVAEEIAGAKAIAQAEGKK